MAHVDKQFIKWDIHSEIFERSICGLTLERPQIYSCHGDTTSSRFG